jgi:hypothetical protein
MMVGRGPCSEGRASRNVRARPSTVICIDPAAVVAAGTGAGAGLGRATDGAGAGCGVGAATGGVPK